LDDLNRYVPERDEAGYEDAHAIKREKREQAERRFRPDNRRSVRMQAILAARRPNRRKRGAR